jgi:hypothetical protein
MQLSSGQWLQVSLHDVNLFAGNVQGHVFQLKLTVRINLQHVVVRWNYKVAKHKIFIISYKSIDMHLSNLVNFQCRKYSNIGCRFDILRSKVHIQCDWSRKKIGKGRYTFVCGQS